MTGGDLKGARAWALAALARRMHTAFEMERGLTARGHPPRVVRAVLEEMSRLGYIDDERFARQWVASRSEVHLHGPARLLADLRRRGVDRETAEAAVREGLPEEVQVELARRAAARKAAGLKAGGLRGRAALYRHLLGRGFAPRIARSVSEEMAPKEEHR